MPGRTPIRTQQTDAGATVIPPAAQRSVAPRTRTAAVQPKEQYEVQVKATVLICIGALFIVVSAAQIHYNKFLMDKHRFPFPVCLAMLHAIFCSVLSATLLFFAPSLFPSLTDPAKKIEVNSRLIILRVLPIAFFFSVSIVLSNLAYEHLSVAFLQMLKEGNVAIVYTMSLLASLDTFSWLHCRVLACVIAATFLTIRGELYFSAIGFSVQVMSQLFECAKIVLQAMLLTSAGMKLDALSYVFLVMPACSVVLGIMYTGDVYVRQTHFAEYTVPSPGFSDFAVWWPHLAANACLAFLLNVVVALFVKHSSAISLILAGVVKDVMIVGVGSLVMREAVTPLQVLGFGMQLGAVMTWSLMKTFPSKFEGGVLSGVVIAIFSPQSPLGTKQTYGSLPDVEKNSP